jgi:site-specific DNA recombinase
VKTPNLLAGLLFDNNGQRLTPTHAVKNGRHYRYYVSHPLITGTRTDAAAGLRLPAGEIEQIVVNRIRRLLSEPASLFAILEAQVGEPLLQQHLMARAAKLAEEWVQMPPLRVRVTIVALVQRVEIRPDEVIIRLRPCRLAALLDNRLTAANPSPVDDEPTLPLTHPAQLRRAGKEVRMVIDHSDPFAPPAKPDPTLVKAIAKAHDFNDKLLRGGVAKFADLAKSEKLHRSYYSQILRLAYLAPDITTAILDGRQPEGLTATMLIEHPHLPLSWQEQRAALGFT